LSERKPVNRITAGSIFLGLALIVVGAAFIFRPLGFIVAGLEMVVLGIVAAKRK
jgi:hypothetical protein